MAKKMIVVQNQFLAELKQMLALLQAKKTLLIIDHDNTIIGGDLCVKAAIDSLTASLPLEQPLPINLLHGLQLELTLTDYWSGKSSLKDLIFRRIDQFLASLPISWQIPDDDYLRRLPLGKVQSEMGLGNLQLQLNFAYRQLGYQSDCKPVSLGRILTAQQIGLMWSRAAKEETWLDREPLF